eukprot:TRINITY_DN6929_c0_g1_i2.p1 TRINITY_DN6929_c0_g1~~TRINITY_DN6929_c0_g1_i2.p1  ORF type:complete len:611 (+),score=220.23 TRINITY_DN6929_c0_g1_i2:66-1898(+)
MISECSYLAPGAKTYEKRRIHDLPPKPRGHTRVVCISDTHNEHERIQLPDGDVLVHAGDVLTESGKRYVTRNKHGALVKYDGAGTALYRRFAQWFTAQPHGHKVMVGGNHDWIFQALGTQATQDVLDAAAKASPHPKQSVAYLVHEHAVAPTGMDGKGFKVFGSPYAHWGSQNDAFKLRDPDFSVMEEGTHMFVTHMPALLPKDHGSRLREDPDMVAAVERCGTLLHVSGHCHWAHGAYHSAKAVKTKETPYVIASICDSQWTFFESPKGRGDAQDVKYGGYLVHFPIMVVDLPTPPPKAGEAWRIGNGLAEDEALERAETDTTVTTQEFGTGGFAAAQEGDAPALLMFAPPTDPEMAGRLLPTLQLHHRCYHFEDAGEAAEFLGDKENDEIHFAVCIAKLGSKGNNGSTVLDALLRRAQTLKHSHPQIVIHSATALQRPDIQTALSQQYNIQQFVGEAHEREMVSALIRSAAAQASSSKLPLVFFGPSTDPAAVRRLLPAISALGYDVLHFTAANDAVKYINSAPAAPVACVAKLGQRGNHGEDVLGAFRKRAGDKAFAAVHSHTALASKKTQRHVHENVGGVDIFVDGDCEGVLLKRLAKFQQGHAAK